MNPFHHAAPGDRRNFSARRTVDGERRASRYSSHFLKPLRHFVEPADGTVEEWIDRMAAGESAARLAKLTWPDRNDQPTVYTESAISKRARVHRKRLAAYRVWLAGYLETLQTARWPRAKAKAVRS